MEKVLEIKGLTKTYKNGRGIRDIGFEVSKGDIYGFLGPNGSGKTTVIKIITGLIRPDAGEVRIFGHDLNDSFEQAMAKVGCLVDTAEAYGHLTAYKNLELAAGFYRDLKKLRIDEVLEEVGLGRFKREKVQDFSLGMKQRLGIAQAILAEPELVVLDEPVNGLDIEGMVEIRETILRLAREKQTTFFISSHLIHEVEQVCSRVGIIMDGRLVDQCDTAEVLNRTHGSLEGYYLERIGRERRGDPS
jgi:ABC-2 type transport system ATP-binding protein